jgi:hypothetical protein
MRLGYVSAMPLDYVLAHAVRATPSFAVGSARSGHVKSALLPGRCRACLHLQMHFRSRQMASRQPLAAALAAIGRMLLTSAIMKFQGQIRYTEYRHMFG